MNDITSFFTSLPEFNYVITVAYFSGCGIFPYPGSVSSIGGTPSGPEVGTVSTHSDQDVPGTELQTLLGSSVSNVQNSKYVTDLSWYKTGNIYWFSYWYVKNCTHESVPLYQHRIADMNWFHFKRHRMADLNRLYCTVPGTGLQT